MDLLVSVIKGFFRRKFGFVFPIIGVSVGVMLVVLVSSVGSVGKKEVENQISSLGVGGIIVSLQDASVPVCMGELEVIRKSSCVSSATPIAYKYSQINCASKTTECLLWGIDDYSKEIMNLQLVYGRNITKSDIVSCNKVCFVDANFAKNIYGRENIIGKKIKLSISESFEEFTVVGIVNQEQSVINAIYSVCIAAVATTHSFTSYERMILWNLFRLQR